MADLIILITSLFILLSFSIIYIYHVKSTPNPEEIKKNRIKIAVVIFLMLLISVVTVLSYLERARSADMMIEYRWKGEDNA